MMLQIPLTDADWDRVRSLFPTVSATRGRPRRNDRDILNAILWVQQTKEKWHRLPASFPPQQTCYQRFMAWKKLGVLDEVRDRLMHLEVSCDAAVAQTEDAEETMPC
jgi:transposase